MAVIWIVIVLGIGAGAGLANAGHEFWGGVVGLIGIATAIKIGERRN